VGRLTLCAASESLNQAKSHADNERVVVDRDRRVAEQGAHLVGCEEANVGSAPIIQGRESLALVDRELQVDVAHPLDLDLRRLDHGDSGPGRVEDAFAVADAPRLCPFALVLGQQARRRCLLAPEDRGDQLVAERARKAELSRREVSDVAQ
jgi:hypothetical protein